MIEEIKYIFSFIRIAAMIANQIKTEEIVDFHNSNTKENERNASIKEFGFDIYGTRIEGSGVTKKQRY